VQVDQINLSGIVERYIVFKIFGSLKVRIQTSSEMGAGCQRNRLVMDVGRGEEVCRKGCPYIRQLANGMTNYYCLSESCAGDQTSATKVERHRLSPVWAFDAGVWWLAFSVLLDM